MEVITIDSEAYQAITRKIDEILERLSTKEKDEWLNNEDICKLLKISRRALQNYRDEKKIPFYRIEGKILYKLSEIEDILNSSRSY